MGLFLAGLVLFLAAHMIAWPKGLRPALIQRLGANGVKLAVSVTSLIGLALLVIGYGQARGAAARLYDPPIWAQHLALVLVPIAFVLTAAAYLPAGRIKVWTRHPMVAGVKVWAFAHVLANGDAASVVLFGALLAWAVGDRISLLRRERAGLVAPAQLSQAAWAGDLGALALGLGAAAAFALYAHPAWIGVRVLPG